MCRSIHSFLLHIFTVNLEVVISFELNQSRNCANPDARNKLKRRREPLLFTGAAWRLMMTDRSALFPLFFKKINQHSNVTRQRLYFSHFMQIYSNIDAVDNFANSRMTSSRNNLNFPVAKDWLPTEPGTFHFAIRPFCSSSHRCHVTCNSQCLATSRQASGKAQDVDNFLINCRKKSVKCLIHFRRVANPQRQEIQIALYDVTLTTKCQK